MYDIENKEYSEYRKSIERVESVSFTTSGVVSAGEQVSISKVSCSVREG